MVFLVRGTSLCRGPIGPVVGASRRGIGRGVGAELQGLALWRKTRLVQWTIVELVSFSLFIGSGYVHICVCVYKSVCLYMHIYSYLKSIKNYQKK